jgi:hypothetical protein
VPGFNVIIIIVEVLRHEVGVKHLLPAQCKMCMTLHLWMLWQVLMCTKASQTLGSQVAMETAYSEFFQWGLWCNLV